MKLEGKIMEWNLFLNISNMEISPLHSALLIQIQLDLYMDFPEAEYCTHDINHMVQKMYRLWLILGLVHCKSFQSNHCCMSFPAGFPLFRLCCHPIMRDNAPPKIDFLSFNDRRNGS